MSNAKEHPTYIIFYSTIVETVRDYSNTLAYRLCDRAMNIINIIDSFTCSNHLCYLKPPFAIKVNIIRYYNIIKRMNSYYFRLYGLHFKSCFCSLHGDALA